MLLQLLLCLLHLNMALSQSTIKTLPGFPGDLPFKLETGYIGVGDIDDVQLFYYFIESERSPKDDPLVLWLTGGPGCSALSGLMYEIGPLQFDYAKSTGNRPVLTLNKYSWTKVANIIFLDSPVGTGFSYSRSWQGYNVSDTITAEEAYEFLRKWLMDHPKFITNPLYIAGDSYSGMIVPIVVQEISDGMEGGHQPPMNLKGYVLGNPLTDATKDLDARVPYAHLKALISDELYESTKLNCKGEYTYPDTSNALCIMDLQNFTDCIGKLYTAHILEPFCATLSPKPMGLKWAPGAFIDDSIDVLLSTPKIPGPWCRNYNYLFIYIWANDKSVQDALHIREGTKEAWERCNKSLSYSYNVPSSLVYHRDLIKKGYRVLVYSGDQDLVIPYVGTMAWIKSLNLTIDSDWEPWFVDGQVAGYTIEYAYGSKYTLTFATVKGGGHTAPEYKPKEALAMIERWFAYYHL